MRSTQSNWLAASLFPLKIYTVFVGIILFCWHANLPPDQTYSQLPFIGSRSHPPEIDQVWFQATTDFAYATHFARFGYFFCAVVLIIKGVIQLYKDSRKTGVFSIIFGLAASLIGLLLTSYAHPPSYGILIS
jgi:hypothetical protein